MASKTVLTFLICVTIVACAFGATFKGMVIDAETKQPIEAAVVVASWSEERTTPAGPTSRFKDVKEALTDKNGLWRIEGPKGGKVGNVKAIFSFLTGMYFTNPPEFIVFKPEYCSWPQGFYIDACRAMKPKGQDKVAGGITVELPRLKRSEDRVRNQGIGLKYDGKDVLRNQRNLIRLLNEERRLLGLPQRTVLEDTEK